MYKSNKYLTLRSFIFITTVTLVAGSYIPSVSATDYSVVAGSQVLLATVNAPIGLTSSNIGGNPAGPASMLESIPLLGGFSRTRGQCLSLSDIVQIDGWNGISINPAGIIAGFTGTINGAVATVQGTTNTTTERTTYSGGIQLDARGYPTALGDAQQTYINKLCATVLNPHTRVTLYAPNNENVGNKLGNIDGYMWIYVSQDTPLGTYPLDGIFISQGPGTSSYASTDITLAGDTLTVIPPPCTINTDTAISFDTHSEAGKKISAPINYQCNELENTTVLEAYLVASAVGSTLSPTELALTNTVGGEPGGAVRGYLGQGADSGSANCIDTANSLHFDGTFTSKLGAVASSLNQQIPLIWQLCVQGNEVPGVATGSVILDIGYK